MYYRMGVAKVPSVSYHLSSMSYRMGVHDHCVRGSKVYLVQFQPTRVLPFLPVTLNQLENETTCVLCSQW